MYMSVCVRIDIDVYRKDVKDILYGLYWLFLGCGGRKDRFFYFYLYYVSLL